MGGRVFQAYKAIAGRPMLACVVAAVLPMVIRIALLPWFPVPAPAIHDEFSYLLGGDTFASGRVANPAHPMWEHFESFHVIQQPAYASKYPPMQAIILAAGQKLGHPWIGVLLSVGLMCGCLCWAMQGWLAPGLAFAGALLAGLRLGVSSYWVNSYWGGAAAAIGGALVIGALPRLLKKPRPSDAFLFATGLLILANSRPYEGLLLACPVLGVMTVMSLRSRNMLDLVRVAALPMLAVLIPGAAAMGYYNYRVTNHWGLLPYVWHEQQYAVASGLLFQEPRKSAPVYRHAVMREFWTGWDVEYARASKAHWISGFKDHVEFGMLFFFGPLVLALVMILLPHPRGNLTDRLTFPVMVLFLAGLLAEKEVPPHYWAPIIALLFLRFMNAVESLWWWRPWGRPIGPLVGMAGFQISLLFSLLLFGPMLQGTTHNRFGDMRRNVQAVLEAMPGRQLVVVRYAPNHSAHQEWVYNRADIDASRVVWARDMGDEANRRLLRYFGGRSVWLFEPDRSLEVVPYDAGVR